MSTDFGNTFVHLRRVSIVGAIFAAVTAILFISVAYAHGHLGTHWPMMVFIPLAIGGILPLVVLPTCFFSIRLDERYVTHLFGSRYVLSQEPLLELVGFKTGGTFAVVFRFSGGARIRFFAAHLGVIRALCARLLELRPDLSESDG